MEAAVGRPGVRKGIILSIMMMLQYAVMGSWFVLISKYLLDKVRFDTGDTAWIMSAVAIASFFTPFIGHWIDKRVSAEKALAVFHILGGIIIYCYSYTYNFYLFFVMAILYAICFLPTLSLTNNIAMRHIPTDKFSWVRMWGVIGWIGVAHVIKLLIDNPGISISGVFNDFSQPVMVKGVETNMNLAVMFQVAAFFSFVLGIFAFFLPRTSPVKEGESERFRMIDSVKLLRRPNMRNVMIVALIMTMAMSLYFYSTSKFLSHLGVKDQDIATTMSIAQWCELFITALLPLAILRFNYKAAISIGILAWALRYFIFAFTGSLTVVRIAIGLHGFCYAFFFVACYQFVDLIADRDKRINAQTLLNLVVVGAGAWIGNFLASKLFSWYIVDPENPGFDIANPAYHTVFLIAGCMCMAGLLYFLFTFRNPKRKETPAA